MDPDLLKKIEDADKKLDAIYKSTEKTRRYFLWTLIVSVVVIVLPLIGMVFLFPIYLKTLSVSGLGI
ncbi:hypothetical protein HY504_03450 [Candidatus Wolfebacteria bacterium]|nr:hypothetical protein [Candidatus Wolfebacteria bacterium]